MLLLSSHCHRIAAGLRLLRGLLLPRLLRPALPHGDAGELSKGLSRPVFEPFSVCFAWFWWRNCWEVVEKSSKSDVNCELDGLEVDWNATNHSLVPAARKRRGNETEIWGRFTHVNSGTLSRLAQTPPTMQRLRLLSNAWRLAPVSWEKPRVAPAPDLHWARLAAAGAVAVASAVAAAKDQRLQCDSPPQFVHGKGQEKLFQSMLRNQGRGFRAQVRMHSNVTTAGKTDIRIIDIVEDGGFFHEVKSGTVTWTQKTIDQIEKDISILRNDPGCKSYTWDFLPGKDGKINVDKRILKKLQDNGIKYEMHHDLGSKRTKDILTSANKKVMEGAKETGQLNGSSKVEAAVKQAQILKAVGAINLAVSLLSLGVALYLKDDIKDLQTKLPEVKKECEEFLESVKKVEELLSEAISQPKNELEKRQCKIKKEFEELKTRFEAVKTRCNTVVERAREDMDASAVTAALSSCTALVGVIVSVASCGCDCGAGFAMGMASIGTGVAGAAVSLDNIKKCERTVGDMKSKVGNITSRYQSVEQQYNALMQVLGHTLHCHLAGAVWRVHHWTHSPSGRIFNIGREDSLALLAHLGNGSVLGAKGQAVMIGAYAGEGKVSVCEIKDIRHMSAKMYEAEVQCSDELRLWVSKMKCPAAGSCWQRYFRASTWSEKRCARCKELLFVRRKIISRIGSRWAMWCPSASRPVPPARRPETFRRGLRARKRTYTYSDIWV